jgi:protease II
MIRDLGFIEWKQESSWMESMSGKRWDAMVEKENKLFLEQIKEPKEVLLAKENDFKNSKKQILFSYENIIINYINKFGIEWHYKNNNSKTYTVSDICTYKSKVYQIRDIGFGSQKYRLECLDGNKILWYKDNVGTNLFIKDELCYFLACEIKLWYNKLYCVEADSGKDKKLVYEEKNRQFNFSLVKGDENSLFLIREDSGLQNLFVIEKGDIVYSNTVLQYYIPVGYHKDKICYLYSDGKRWKSSGFILKKEFDNEIIYASLSNNVIICIDNGLRTVYDFDFKLLHTYYGNFIYNLWDKNHFERYFIDTTGAGIIEYKYHKPVECITYYGVVKRIIHNSVPIIVVKPHCKPKALLCIGYGSYGIPTNISTPRWEPYINDGWIICFICVRGSGDVNKSWAESAKKYNKEYSFIDFETSIRKVQEEYKISAKDTCIYGRSAGGYLVGGVVSRNPKGDLFKMVYAEVPYVDVLRTTTNPSLPLTALEYNEFGNPAEGIQEFRTIMNYSPVDSLDFENPPDLNIIVRTSENDSQVYAYESYKWLESLRGKNKSDKRKILYNSKNKGHFVNSYENFSQDFFLLKSFRR